MTAAGCPSPRACPVPDPPRTLQADDLALHQLPAGSPFYRVYRLAFGYDSFNPGRGDTRFAPLRAGETLVATMYGGSDEATVLLESVFHDVHARVRDRVVYERTLRQHGLAYVRAPRPMQLVDLRDGALPGLGLHRHQLVATTAQHYPCTREWSERLHRFATGADGLLWDSRQAELRPGLDHRGEAFMLFGDRAPAGPGSYPLAGPGVRNLTEGAGRLLVDEIAERLDARIEPAGP